ncbi:hypothetical protein Cpir12675_005165 [Ceratocystis pirilliformis]|uniref:Protein kinase domain-containing protein n=1 Tax=Ceratocystis pirilliformis TaxID=259994 RepID=A0ABR3YSV9_9PEZI
MSAIDIPHNASGTTTADHEASDFIFPYSPSSSGQSPRLTPNLYTDLPPSVEETSESDDGGHFGTNSGELEQHSSATSTSTTASPSIVQPNKSQLSTSVPKRNGRGSGSFSFTRMTSIFRRNNNASTPTRDLSAAATPADRSPTRPKSSSGNRHFLLSKSGDGQSQRSVTPPSPDSADLEMRIPLRNGQANSNAALTPAPSAHVNVAAARTPSPTLQVMTPVSTSAPSSTPTIMQPSTSPPVANGKPAASSGGNISFLSRSKRSSTGLSLSRAFRIPGKNNSNGKLEPVEGDKSRANSFDASSQREAISMKQPTNPACEQEQCADEPHMRLTRSPWAFIPETGTGVKARRMSLSLPDDFLVVTTELMGDYSYESRLGRRVNHLGKGATSTVVRMIRRDTSEYVAVKEFRAKSKADTQEQYEKKVKSEFTIAKSLHHPNIVETLALCTHKGRWNHVMEYCGAGDLYSIVESGCLKKAEREKDRQCLFKQLVQGVNYLHSNGIAHRDIKLENLLITNDSKLKITDFGVSDVFSGIHPGLREAGGVCGKNMGVARLCHPGICGSEPYIAPEVLANKTDYDPRPLDVWGSAVIMINLIFGSGLWTRAEAGQTHYDSLVRGWLKFDEACAAGTKDREADYPFYKAFDLFVFPPVLRRLLLRMLHPDPAKRITMTEVVNHRWIRGIECCQADSYEDPVPIDVSKADTLRNTRLIACHNHLPPANTHSHFIGRTGH